MADDTPDPTDSHQLRRAQTTPNVSQTYSSFDDEDDETDLQLPQTRGSAILEPQQPDVDPVHVAVVWIRKAEHGSTVWRDDCTKMQIKAYYFKKKLKPLFFVIKYAFLFLAVFETPSYCLTNTSQCPGPQHPEMYGSGVYYIDPKTLDCIAICFWLYFVFHLILRYLARHHLGPWQITATVLVSIGLLDCFVGLFNSKGLMFWTSFVLWRLIRPLVFICFTKELRKSGTRVILTMHKFCDILFAIAICILFFSWLGLVMYAETSEGNANMFSWTMAVSSLWILFTTANCPDVFLPAYNENSLNVLFFVVFLIISLYLLNNILLAAVYDAWKESLKEELIEFMRHRQFSINHAYHLLADPERHGITKERWAIFFTLMCDPSLHDCDIHELTNTAQSQYNRQRADRIFVALDKDKSKLLRKHEFTVILDVMQNPDSYIPRQERPQNVRVLMLDTLFTNGITWNGETVLSWDAFVDCIIAIDVSIVLCQTIVFVNGGGAFNYAPLGPDGWWYWFLFCLSCFYVIVLTLKIVTYGPERFWFTNPWHNRFDLFNVYGCFAAEIACVSLGHPIILLRFVLALHISRACRLFQYIQSLRLVGTLIVRLQPTYVKITLLLLVVFYVYAMIGLQLYGGLIYEGNPSLAGTDFAESEYWKINFNDFNNSLVTLFVLMVFNNWVVIAEALVIASGWKYTSILYVLTFFFIVNLIVLNILVALILDCHLHVLEEMDEDPQTHDSSKFLMKVLLDDDFELEEHPRAFLRPTSAPA